MRLLKTVLAAILVFSTSLAFATNPTTAQQGVFKGTFVGKSYSTDTTNTDPPQREKFEFWLQVQSASFFISLVDFGMGFSATGSVGPNDGYVSEASFIYVSFHYKGTDKMKGSCIFTLNKRTYEGKLSLARDPT